MSAICRVARGGRYGKESRCAATRRSTFFNGCRRRRAEAFLGAVKTRRFAHGSAIYTQSERGSEMYRLLSGSVRLSVMRHDGRELLYMMFEPGDCIGAVSVVDDEPRPHTATAQGDVEAQVLRRDVFERLRVVHPEFNDALLRLISRYMRFLSDYFAGSTLDELPQRVARRIVEASTSFGVASARGIRVAVRLPQGEIALMVGASRQSVNKVVQQFQEEGLLSVEYGTLLVHDLDRLRRIAAG